MANLGAMNPEQRHQRLVFITGISLGLVLGGAIVFFSQNTQIIKYPIEVSQNTIDNIVSRVMGSLNSKKDSTAIQEVKRNKVLSSTQNSVKNDSLKIENLSDSVNASHDTILNTGNLAYSQSGEEEILVRKDELVTSRFVEVVNLDFKTQSNTKDSLMQVVSGVQLEKRNRKKFPLLVEFWKSPLNYRGYKLFKDKLVLFGLDPMDEVLLIYTGEVYYLKCIMGIFKLTVTDDFRSYERVNNPSISNLFEL